MRIRRAMEGDADAVWAVRTAAIREGCRGHYAPEVLDAWSSAPMPPDFAAFVGRAFFVAEESGALVGCVALTHATGELDALFVRPEAHRRGVATALVKAAEEGARAAGVGRIHLNATLNAVPFYERAGYLALERTRWRHPSGFVLACVKMEKVLRFAPEVP